MKIYTEQSLTNFEFWGGANDRVQFLNDEQLDTIEQMLEDITPEEGWNDTAINDFFWFEEDTIAEWLGYNSWEDLVTADEEDDEENEDEDED